MTKAWVVRVILFTKLEPLPAGLLACMSNPGSLITLHQDDDEKQVFDLHRPKHVSVKDSKRWAEGVESRMRTFRLNGVAAPEWPPPERTDYGHCMECGTDMIGTSDGPRCPVCSPGYATD